MPDKLIPLTPHDLELTESLYCAGISGGKLIHHADLGGIGDASDVLIVQQGLAGVDWRKMIEEKARALVKVRRDVSVLVSIPSGIKADEGILGISHEDLARILSENPKFFEEFTLSKFMNGLFRLIKSVRQDIREECRLHLAGQSYGAMALLLALRKMAVKRMNSPASVSFLAPFVKVSLDSDPGINLTISNPDSKLDTDGRIARLKRVLDECCNFYTVPKGHDLLAEHQRLFNELQFAWIGDLSDFCRGTRIQIIRGSKDPYISDGHSRLIKSRMMVDTEITLEGDNHDLESLDFESLCS